MPRSAFRAFLADGAGLRQVIHDEISVSEASAELDMLMRKKPVYNWWQLVLIGGMCSAAICTVSFNGSFIDALVSFPLGALLVAIQLLSVRNELYSNVFEYVPRLPRNASESGC